MITKIPGNARFRAVDGDLARSAQMRILEMRQGPRFVGQQIRAGDRPADRARLMSLRAVMPKQDGRFVARDPMPGRDNPDGLVRLPSGRLCSQPLGIEVKPFYSTEEMAQLRERFPRMTTDQILRELTRLGNQSGKI
jgi:hypothetical protein